MAAFTVKRNWSQFLFLLLVYLTPWFTHQGLRVRLSAVIDTLLSSVMEKINSSGTEDGERLIIKLMITSHSHEFTQIMQMKSYHEWTLLCSVFTLDLLCSDHFHWLVHGKFSMTISLLAHRYRDAEWLILYRCFLFFLFSFLFFRRLISEVTELISTKHGDTFTYDCYFLVLSPPGVYHPRAWGKPLFGTNFILQPKLSLQRNIISTIGKKLVNLQGFPKFLPTL